MNITAQMVKELRDKTGAGMMDAKKALVETDGDMEKAMDVLRQKGIASAEKKMGRIAAEGLIASAIIDNAGAMVEVNCETDFVAKNEEFKELANCLAKAVAETNPADVESFVASTCPKCGKTIEEVLKEKIASIGEKITFRRFVRYEGNVATYIHNGKIGVLLETDKKDEELMNDICLHIASNAPEFLSRAEIPQSAIDHETEIEMGKEDLQKKPENIRAKIVEGRVNKLMAAKVLLEQPFVKNPDVTIEQLIEGKLTIKAFSRYVLGEGLEKRQDNFAEEVMSQVKG
ncbi:elongation factor Ts [bacterium]|uniref:Elongation factor Ts n=1 Tax=Candidatus Scatenecus faecavium TaxID=2840915 RepID=A0A9D1FUQ2_9BACT|nr:elongation factor Ts [bacterium]HIS82370.1 elongation factor Ts [Candidatus Scatenecus faecavium]